MKKVSGFLSLLALCGMLAMAGCSSGGSKGGNTPANSSSKEITSFEIISPVTAVGIIDESAKTINVTVPYATDVTKLIVKFETTGAKTSIGSVEQISSTTENDFTTQKNYTVTAQDGSTSTYVVRVAIAESSAKDITKFEIAGQSSSVINGNAITVTMPYGTSGTTFSPTVTHTGASVSPASGASQSFTNPVTYTVTAADGSTKEYTVKVNNAAPSTVNTLSSLVLSAGTLSPTFASGTTGYTASVNSSVSSITVTPTLTDTTAGVTVNTVAVTNGNASGAIALTVGANTITIAVTSQSGAVNTYTIVVNRSITITTTGSGIASKITYNLPGGTVFSEIQTTADSVTSITFPMGADDASTGTITAPFVMSETDVTYQLWKEVYDWATNSARGTAVYSFANPGQNGLDLNGNALSTATSTQYPVTTVNWRDAIVWCNAFTEYYNANNGAGTDLAVVYCTDSGYGTPIRTSTNSTTITYTTNGTQDAPYVNLSSKGFRLPTSMEYEFAARYIGTSTSNTNVVLKNGVYYTNGNSASGATASYSDETATGFVAVYEVSSTAVVKSKAANALGLYDMSGNVWKWNFDWTSGSAGGSRVLRGGEFSQAACYMIVCLMNNFVASPESTFFIVGFRFSRTK